MNLVIKFVLLSVFIITFTTEAMAQRRGNRGRNNGVRSGGRANRTVTRRPNYNPRRGSNVRRQAPLRTYRPVVRNYRNNIYRNNRRFNQVPYRHRVNVNNYRHLNRRFRAPRSYFGFLRNNYSNFFHRNWILFPTARGNGFFLNNNYPYFVFNGYQHRYSAYDRCNYELVDGYSNLRVQPFFNQFCNIGYNQCAILRDNLNHAEFSNRYYCAESYRF